MRNTAKMRRRIRGSRHMAAYDATFAARECFVDMEPLLAAARAARTRRAMTTLQ